MAGYLEPGDVIVEGHWKGLQAEWTVMDLQSGQLTGGWEGRYLPGRA
jgi:hypothetical protein